MQPIEFSFIIDSEDAGTRLDVYLAEQDDPPLSRSQVKRSIDRGEVSVNDAIVKAGYALRAHDLVRWQYHPPRAPNLEAQAIPLDFLYNDEELAVVNKPSGMVVHPSPGHPDATLVNALLYHFERLSKSGHTLRPGIVHRIDKDTSGALVISKTDRAHQHLAKLFETHTIERIYHAIVYGPNLADSGTFDTLHGRDPRHRKRFSSQVAKGRHAITHYEVLERFSSGACLVQCQLETGRTHQIRMHFSDANAPLLGDSLYAGRTVAENKLITRQALHALTLGFPHLNGEMVRCVADYPEDFRYALDALRQGKSWR